MTKYQERKFNDVEEQRIAERYQEDHGLTVGALAKEFGCCASVARDVLLRQGVQPRIGRPTAVSLDAERILELEEQGWSQQQIADELGLTQVRVSRFLRKHGVHRGEARQAYGPTHPRWKKGVRHEKGYVLVWVDPSDPMAVMADSQGYVREHRLVMARHLGRPLGRSETVHHKDLDHSNNVLSNLQLRQGRHGKGAAFQCLDCGSHNVVAKELD